jgi:hypothetical protein
MTGKRIFLHMLFCRDEANPAGIRLKISPNGVFIVDKE